MDNLWAIILAAGESKRMGFPKMMLPFKEKTMIENVIANVADSNVDKILVVLGSSMNMIAKLIENLGIAICYNENYTDGMLSSVKFGFNNLPVDYKAVLVFQGDQPLISRRAINAVIDAYKSSDKGIVIPVYRNKRGHPILIDRKYLDEVQKLSPSKGLRYLASKFPADVLEIETDEPGILRDFDTYDQYLNEINLIK